VRRRLPRSFYARPAHEVAPDLLGRVIVRRLPDGTRLAARIVEAEAYGPADPASHAFRGRTARNAVMFGPPGCLYVYFTYGNHWMMNAVTGRDGAGEAVLLRAAEPLEGLDLMALHRGRDDPRLLCAGPGRLAQAFGATREHDGEDLVRGGAFWIETGSPVPIARVARGIRVGVNVGVEEEWRFWIRGDPYVSPGRPGPTRRAHRARRALHHRHHRRPRHRRPPSTP
jgi:DNA-3-methyladenine glycosylase